MCLLCKCQEEIIKKTININGLKIDDIQVNMKAFISTIKSKLSNELKTIMDIC
jgi:hypothetical protein